MARAGRRGRLIGSPRGSPLEKLAAMALHVRTGVAGYFPAHGALPLRQPELGTAPLPDAHPDSRAAGRPRLPATTVQQPPAARLVLDGRVRRGIGIAADGLGDCRGVLPALFLLPGEVPCGIDFQIQPAAFCTARDLWSSLRFANEPDQTGRMDSQFGAELAGLVSGRDGAEKWRRGKAMASDLTITVNGARHVVSAAPQTPLLHVLRNDLRLTGPRLGCGIAQCGACAVLVDGKEVRSCIAPVSSVIGKRVVTIEGLPGVWAAEKGFN